LSEIVRDIRLGVVSTVQRIGKAPPQFAALSRKGCKYVKNDVLDAGAICEAAGRPTMRFVPLCRIAATVSELSR
jgi:hypothetical protein